MREAELSRLRGPRKWIFVSAVPTLILASAGYGFLVRSRHVFPYRLIRRASHALHISGRPKPVRHTAPVAADTAASPEAIRRLANLPYLNGYRAADGGGAIRIHDRALAEDGLNFFTSGHTLEATLMDMDGTVVRTWTADPVKAFPRFAEMKRWRHPPLLRDAELLADGGIAGIFDEVGIVRLDADSRVIWTWPGRVHHDLFVSETGTFWVLLNERRVVPGLGREDPVLEDFVAEISAQGRLLRRISLVESFQRSDYAPMLARIPADKENIFHTNSVTVLDGSLASRSAAFRRGNLLVSIRNLNTIAVVSPDAGRVVWALSGQWYRQHCARLLPTGHLLLFDNLGAMRPASRALELEPFTQEILWSYGGRPGEALLSATVGYVQRLRGGNTLITESTSGRVVEVTPNNRVVWEFVNPDRIRGRVEPQKEIVPVVYFMQRVGRDLPFLTWRAAGSPSGPRPSPPRAAPTPPERAGTPPRAAT